MEAQAKAKWDDEDSVRKAIISQSLSDKQKTQIKGCETTKELLETLGRAHGFSTSKSEVLFIRNFTDLS